MDVCGDPSTTADDPARKTEAIRLKLSSEAVHRVEFTARPPG